MEEKGNSTSISLVNLGDSKLLGKIYDDLAQPGVQKVGKALGTVLDLTNTLVAPVWMLNEYVDHKKREVFKRNMENLRGKIDEIPEDKVCEAPPEIGVPIMEKLTYVTNEQIRDAYTNLLTKASSSETAMLAHPAFVGMVEKLSTDEAKVIQFLKGKNYLVFLNYKFNLSGGGFEVEKNFATGLEFEVPLSYKENIDVYLDNLSNLGIIKSQGSQYKLNEELYSKVREKYLNFERSLDDKSEAIKLAKNSPQIPEEFKKNFPQYTNWDFSKGFFEITHFGKLFIKACTHD